MERGNSSSCAKRKPYKCKISGKVSRQMKRSDHPNSSVEVSVMGIERRGWVNTQRITVNWVVRRTIIQCVCFRLQSFIRLIDTSRMTGDCHVVICEGLEV